MSDIGGNDFDDMSDMGEDMFDDIDDSIDGDESVDGEESDEEETDFRFIDVNDPAQFNTQNMRFTKIQSGSEFRRIPDNQRISRNYMDRYEFAKCLAVRTEQIAHGAEPLIDVPEGVTDSDQIALLEILQKKTPFILVRKIPRPDLGNVEEWWKLEDLIIQQVDY
jgi:DNA-directed RNA polymerase subunit K/omega